MSSCYLEADTATKTTATAAVVGACARVAAEYLLGGAKHDFFPTNFAFENTAAETVAAAAAAEKAHLHCTQHHYRGSGRAHASGFRS